MKKWFWKLRYARHMCKRMNDFSQDGIKFALHSADVSWTDLDGPNSDPIDSANEELECWGE